MTGAEFATGFMEGVIGYTGTIWSSFGLGIALIIGLPLGFWIITKVISLVRERQK